MARTYYAIYVLNIIFEMERDMDIILKLSEELEYRNGR